VPSLRRHQLAHLSPAGWEAVRQGPWDAEARECLAFWARRQLPLVVTQQRAGVLDGHLALGLPAPLRWQRRRLALHAPIRGLMYFDEFPAPAAVLALLPASVRDEVSALASRLAGLGVDVRVYGSHGWQRITGLSYLRPGSDLDLRLAVPDAATADATVALLAAARLDVPRLDGELVFGDGSAVAWREWLAWRDGRTERILVKRLHGVSLEAGEAWLLEPLEC
jgi:phosphoribosyl-dephospho-CoA transferase